MSWLYSPVSYCHVFSVWRHIIVTCLRNSPGSGARVPGLSLHQVLQSVLYPSKYPLYTRHTWLHVAHVATRGHTWLNTSWTRTASAWSASEDTPCNQSQLSIVNTLTNDSLVFSIVPAPGPWLGQHRPLHVHPAPATGGGAGGPGGPLSHLQCRCSCFYCLLLLILI